MEYLPDPLILLPAATVRTRVEVVAEVGSTVIVGDAFLAHDPAGRGRPFRRLAGETSLRRPGATPFALERFDVTGERVADSLAPARSSPLRGTGHPLGVRAGPADEMAATLGRALEQVPGVHAGATTLSGGAGVMARLLAHDAVALGDGFRAAWRALRCALTGLPPTSRRQSGWL